MGNDHPTSRKIRVSDRLLDAIDWWSELLLSRVVDVRADINERIPDELIGGKPPTGNLIQHIRIDKFFFF